jgi:hypothetical protein
VKPRFAGTRLVLSARDNTGKPLAGYEIHARSGEDEQPELLGLTDHAGAFELPREDGTLVTLYIRNGRQLLAKLPIVPGHVETAAAKLPDDDPRLQAEGFIAAISSRAVDLVARREILAARIRARLKAGKLSEAQQFLDEFRKIETRADLNRDIQQFRLNNVISDPLTRSRTDKLFQETQKLLLLRALSDDLLIDLTREVAQVRGVE